jgi:hypothetical protein
LIAEASPDTDRGANGDADGVNFLSIYAKKCHFFNFQLDSIFDKPFKSFSS